MAKLIQICASHDDLFGLDGDGVVYQYNFQTNGWRKLGRGRGDLLDPTPGGERLGHLRVISDGVVASSRDEPPDGSQP